MVLTWYLQTELQDLYHEHTHLPWSSSSSPGEWEKINSCKNDNDKEVKAEKHLVYMCVCVCMRKGA